MLGMVLRVDSFATYVHSCRICLLEFFFGFKRKNNKKYNYSLKELCSSSFSRKVQPRTVPRQIHQTNLTFFYNFHKAGGEVVRCFYRHGRES